MSRFPLEFLHPRRSLSRLRGAHKQIVLIMPGESRRFPQMFLELISRGVQAERCQPWKNPATPSPPKGLRRFFLSNVPLQPRRDDGEGAGVRERGWKVDTVSCVSLARFRGNRAPGTVLLHFLREG